MSAHRPIWKTAGIAAFAFFCILLVYLGIFSVIGVAFGPSSSDCPDALSDLGLSGSLVDGCVSHGEGRTCLRRYDSGTDAARSPEALSLPVDHSVIVCGATTIVLEGPDHRARRAELVQALP